MDYMVALFEFISKTGQTDYRIEKALDMTQGNISKWRNGRGKPGLEVLIKLADHFGVSVDTLVGRTEAADTTLAVLPKNVRDIIRVCSALGEPERAYILAQVRALADLLESLQCKTVAANSGT